MTEEADIKRLTYLFEHDHKEYGRLGMVKLISGERYCFFCERQSSKYDSIFYGGE